MQDFLIWHLIFLQRKFAVEVASFAYTFQLTETKMGQRRRGKKEERRRKSVAKEREEKGKKKRKEKEVSKEGERRDSQ
jgi:hypothetical protein